MALGQYTQEATYSKSSDETFADVQKVIGIIGKVEKADKSALAIEEGERPFSFKERRKLVNSLGIILPTFNSLSFK